MDGKKLMLLKLLLDAEEFISYEQLAEYLDVSTRSVLRFMKEIQTYVLGYDIRVELKKRKGIKLVGTKEDKERLLASMDNKTVAVYTGNERMIMIMIELFQPAQEYTKLYYLAYRLHVSMTTLHNDLSSIEDYLSLNHVRIHTQRGEGVRLQGKRKDIAWAMASFLLPYMEWGHDTVRYQYLLNEQVQEAMHTFFSLSRLWEVKRLADAFDYTLASVFVLEDYHHFLILITIMIWYPQYLQDYEDSGYQSPVLESQVNLRYGQFMKKVNQEAKANRLSMSSSSLYTAAYLSMRKVDLQTDAYQYDEELYYLTLHFLGDLEQELAVALNRDADLVDRLSMHMKLMIHRIKMGTVISNTYLSEVKKKYMSVFSAVMKHLQLFENRYGIRINENEIGYITVHVLASMIEQENCERRIKVAVLCMSGMGTSKMLTEMLMRRYPLLQVEHDFSLEEFHEMQMLQEGYDMVVSTISLETMMLPVVVVHPIPTEQDYEAVNKLYEKLSRNRHDTKDIQRKASIKKAVNAPIPKQKILERLQTTITIVDQFRIEEISASGLRELWTGIANRALHENDREEFYEKIRLREELGNTVIPELKLLLIHCRLKDIIQLKLYKLKQSFTYMYKAEQYTVQYALLMIAPVQEQLQVLECMSSVSMHAVADEAFQKALLSKDDEEFITMLTRILLADMI